MNLVQVKTFAHSGQEEIDTLLRRAASEANAWVHLNRFTIIDVSFKFQVLGRNSSAESAAAVMVEFKCKASFEDK
jgi:hypothetical protein